MVCSRVVRKSGPRPQARDASTEAERSRLSARLSFQDLEVCNFTVNTEVSGIPGTYEQRSGKNPILPRTQW